MRKKRAITLMEIMIVILLIGLIGGVVSYNLKGSLDKGKAFASKEGAQKLQDIINMELQQGYKVPASDIAHDESPERIVVRDCVVNSGLVSAEGANKIIKDGWGEYYHIGARAQNQVEVSSPRLKQYDEAHGR